MPIIDGEEKGNVKKRTPATTDEPLRVPGTVLVPAEITAALATKRGFLAEPLAAAIEHGGRVITTREIAGIIRILAGLIDQQALSDAHVRAIRPVIDMLEDMAKGLDKTAARLNDEVRALEVGE